MTRIAALILVLLLSCGFSHGRGPETFYVSNSGNDSNNGLTPTTAWATPGKVASSSFNSGDTVAFDGGSTFSAGMTLSQANAPGFLTLTNYNSGQPTFNTGSNTCVTAHFFPGLTVNNLNCVGGGNLTTTINGILVDHGHASAAAADTNLAGPQITNNTISQYGENCILVASSTASTSHAGYSGINISGNTIHDCGGDMVLSGDNGSCAHIYGNAQLLFRDNHNDITISGNTIFNCTGNGTGNSGFGIFVQEAGNILISNNLIHDGGSLVAGHFGPVGIIVNTATLATVSFNEVYNWQTGPGGGDGEGFDFDIGEINSVMEYNYAHNDSFGEFMLFGTGANNIIRFNIAESGINDSAIIQLLQQPGTGTAIYGNTLYANEGIPCVNAANNGNTSITWTIANNICLQHSNGYALVLNLVGAGSTLNITGNDWYCTSPGPCNFNLQGTAYASLAAIQAAGFEKVLGSPVGTTANPNLASPGSGGTCGGYNGTCPTAYDLTTSSPAGKGNGLNLNTLYGFNVGTQDFYGNAITNTTLPIGAAANQ